MQLNRIGDIDSMLPTGMPGHGADDCPGEIHDSCQTAGGHTNRL